MIKMGECRVCGDEISKKDLAALPDSTICCYCAVLQDVAKRLLNKNPRKAINYFTVLSRQARQLSKSEKMLDNNNWEATRWDGQKTTAQL